MGFALHTIGDRVKVTRAAKQEVTITRITCEETVDKSILELLPTESHLNTASVGITKLMKDQKLSFGFDVEIHKGIPLGSGLGGSAASAVAAVVAANRLLPKPFKQEELLVYALEGEAIASGSYHSDNVGPCLLGGLTLTPSGTESVIRIPMPKNLRVASVYPGFRLDTKKARTVLPETVELKKHVVASGRLGGFIASCHSGDLDLMKASLLDDIIEPARASLIPGFHRVQNAALESGAIACSISGAGPSVYALGLETTIDAICLAMKNQFVEAGHKNVLAWTSDINHQGAQVVS